MQKKFTILYLEFLKILFKNKMVPVKIISGKLKGLSWGVCASTNNEYVLGNYEPDLQKIMSNLIRPNDVIFDIGAHYGYFTLLASRLVGNSGMVYSFEPMPQNFKGLEYNILINKINNAKLINCALSNKDSILQFSNNKNTVANTYISGSPIFDQLTSIIRLKATSLDNLLLRKEVALPNFMKIDVEGAEYDVLDGAGGIISQSKPFINLSTHDNHCPGVSEKCLALLKRHNYKVDHYFTNPANKGIQEFFLTAKDIK